MKRGRSVDARNERGLAYGEAAVRSARKRGATVINHGAGVMPVGAAAPNGGVLYTLLTASNSDAPTHWVPAHVGSTSDHRLYFPDAPSFQPTLTPAECLQRGIFGGCYFNPVGGKAGIFGREVAVDAREFPSAWFAGLDESLYLSRRYVPARNKYGVKSGQDQKAWEAKGWIHEQDPRGWFQWYCRFFQGRRTADDERQIKRWEACAGAKGRWRGQLCGRLHKSAGRYDDARIASVIRQTLLHWAYELSEVDYTDWQQRKAAAG